MVASLLMVGSAMAIDLNDHVRLTLDGGEAVDGYFYQAGPDSVVLTNDQGKRTTRVPLGIVARVQVNDGDVPLDAFTLDVRNEWKQWTTEALNPPAHPAPVTVAIASALLAGSGHGLLKQWDEATSMMVIDAACMTLAGLELAGHGTGRVDVLIGSAAVSLVFKSYAMADGVRSADRIRKRMRAAGGK